VYKEGIMPRYRLSYGRKKTFESDDIMGVLDQMGIKSGKSESKWLSDNAMDVCNYAYKPIRFGTKEEFVEDLVKINLLEELSQ
jgi:hypothetical protein|tara:strand:+ start:235 stop:483 length:249 start_codon:yes stop_codon:yes gene_type:complete